jgi:hypothetical protein
MGKVFDLAAISPGDIDAPVSCFLFGYPNAAAAWTKFSV